MRGRLLAVNQQKARLMPGFLLKIIIKTMTY